MAIGGGGGGGGGGAKKETIPRAHEASFGSNLESTNRANRRDARDEKICDSGLVPSGSMLEISPPVTINPRFGARPSLEIKGGVVLGQIRVRDEEVQDFIPAGSTTRGPLSRNTWYTSNKLPGHQADCWQGVPSAIPPTKRVKFDKSQWGSFSAKSDHVVRNTVPPNEEYPVLTTESIYSKKADSENKSNISKVINTKGKPEAETKIEKCKATPPTNIAKSQSRLSVNMPSKSMKTLFAATGTSIEQPQANVRSRKQVQGCLTVRMNPLQIKGSASVLENNKMKKKRIWEDSPSSAGVCHSHSQSSNHSVYLCHCEKAEYDTRLTDLAKGAIAQNICIPGSAEETDIMKRESCTVLQGILKTITRSHQHQICYYGRFCLKNFFCNKTGDVKTDGLQPLPLTSYGSQQDKKRTAGMIRTEFFMDRVVPPGIELLLSLLKAKETQNEELVENHTSVQPRLKKLALCEFMYRNLVSLRGSNPTKYQQIIQEVKAKLDFKSWKGPVKLNVHLNKVLEHKNRGTNEATHYDETTEGLLHYVYNSIKHLTDHAYKDGVLQYTDDEIDDILSGTFAGIIEAFQEAMFHKKRLFKLD